MLLLSSFNFTLKNSFFQHQYQKQVKMFYFMIGSLWGLYSHTIFLWCGSTKYLQSIKRRSKVQKNNMSCKRALNLDQRKETISQWEFDYGLLTNLPTIIVAREFSPCSFKLKRHPTSLYKMRILTWKLLVI